MMRENIVHPGADELIYEIRGIVDFAKKLEKAGVEISWENIGDPIAKGEKVPEWIKDIIVAEIQKNNGTFGYSPTMGLEKTREYIAHERNIEGGIQITPNDILFFNGLGDAISKIYELLNPSVRVVGPNPAYPTHSSAEGAHAGSRHISYKLNPKNNWYPDLEDLENKVKYNPHVVGILIVNPDNPTGMVYPQEVIASIVDIARRYNLFIISDEIYSNIFYGGSEHKKLASVIGDVPGIAMRGVSKEFPWPGARCGWIEFYNRDKDEVFDRYCRSLVDAKMLEVCSTTLPQAVIPEVMSDERYFPYLAERNAMYEKRSEEIYEKLSDVEGVLVNKAYGAFYMTIVFEGGVLNDKQSLPVENKEAQKLLSPLLSQKINLDKRFVYYLLSSTGICVVPLSSGFNSDLNGFRITLLEKDDDKFSWIIGILKDSIKEYLSS